MIRYAVTQRSSFLVDEGQRAAQLLHQAARWAAGGVDFVQLREKDLDAGALADLAKKMAVALSPKTMLLINGRADVAVASGAAGVHLSAHPEELTPHDVRQVYAAAGLSQPIVSISCHTLAEVEHARVSGADLILFAPVFEKRMDGEAAVQGTGLESLRQACEAAAPVKVLALGGVTRENARACVLAGAAGIAGIRLFLDSP